MELHGLRRDGPLDVLQQDALRVEAVLRSLGFEQQIEQSWYTGEQR